MAQLIRLGVVAGLLLVAGCGARESDNNLDGLKAASDYEQEKLQEIQKNIDDLNQQESEWIKMGIWDEKALEDSKRRHATWEAMLTEANKRVLKANEALNKAR